MAQLSRWNVSRWNVLLVWSLLGLIVRPASSQSLSTRGSTLRAVRIDKSGLGFEINFSGQRFVQQAPLTIETVDSNGQAQWVKGGYSSWKANGKTLRAEGELLSSHGTRFLFRDTYQSDATGFQLKRRVEVASPHPQDAGFSSRFGIAWAKPLKVSAGDAIMPGVWYCDNQSIPPKAFPVALDEEVMMLREDRLGLPLVGFRDRESGVSLTLQRVGGQPTTFAGDAGRERQIDRRMQTGALGFLHDEKLEQAFSFPGSEDERSSIAPDSLPGQRYLPRSHPVEAGFVQDYTLHFEVRRSSSFAEFMEGTMKASIALANPPLLRADLPQAYRASQDLLSTVIQPYNGTVAVPFYASLPHGEIKDTSTQMGFVGMALPCAALLLKDGLESKNADVVARAEKVIGFWVEQAATPSGNPKTWADFPAPGQVTWRDYPTHLRVASDGLEGVLQAWSIARRHGMDRAQWLEFAQRYGDFLVEKQK